MILPATNPTDPSRPTIYYKLQLLAAKYNLELVELMRLLEDWQNFINSDLNPPISQN